jgi:hypothetical protein
MVPARAHFPPSGYFEPAIAAVFGLAQTHNSWPQMTRQACPDALSKQKPPCVETFTSRAMQDLFKTNRLPGRKKYHIRHRPLVLK